MTSARRLSRRGFIAGLALAVAVPRRAVARAPIIDASAFGAVGDGRTDAAAALNAAAQAIPAEGGILYVPPGRYRITSTIVLQSGTTLTGSGATIVGTGAWAPSAGSRPLVTNVGRADAIIHDHEITVREIAFEYVGPQFGEAHAVEFRKVRGVIVEDCSFSGGGDATAFLACRDTEVARCISQGTLNCAFDHWEGSSNCIVHDCLATCSRNYGILFTGVGTDANDHQQATHVAALNNDIRSPTEAGIWVCALSQYSSVSDVMLRGNHVYGGPWNASGIGATGEVRSLQILDNRVDDISGGPAIFTRPDKWNRPRSVHIIGNRLTRCVTNEQNVALIEALGDEVEVAANRSTGGHFPSMVWVDGKKVMLRDNMASGFGGRPKYNTTGAANPILADPDQ